ncbi:MAG: metal-dependent transcriptional regulator [Candidatus Kuenenia sp.]|nr:metal-dependent transcriptional regulator [Candidatus Kuenenia hertensis]
MSMIESCHEELLELIWTIDEERGETDKELLMKKEGSASAEDYLQTLINNGYISVKDNKVILTEKGQEEARLIIRRHRLAERLLHDVLEVKDETMDSSACEFEHFLSEEVTTSICTLLGHPLTCPHGKPIPPGDCCEKANKEIRPVVFPLTELQPGNYAKISYIVTKFHSRMDRLSSMGLLPGVKIHLHQKYPTYVIQMGQTQIAIDSTVARDIYVRQG